MKLFRWAIVLLFVVVCYWEGNAHADSCVTGSNNTLSSWIMVGQTSYKDIVWTGPSNNLVSSISVNLNYSKNAGALLHFYLNKLNNGTGNVNIINDVVGAPLSNYSFTVNNISNFNNTPINGTWRLTMAHDALYQSPNIWGDNFNDCSRCHPGAQFKGWSMTVCYHTACNLLINSFTQSASQFYPGNGETVHYASTISGNDGSTIYWSLNVGGRGYNGTGTTVSVDWDGKDATGQLVAQGNYQAVLTTWTSTSCQKSQSLTVYVNRTCSLEVTGISQTKTMFNPFAGEQVTFGGFVTNATGSSWQISVADRIFTGTGLVGATWNGKNAAGAYVADANYPVTLRVSTVGCSDAKTTYVATGAPKQLPSDAPNSCSEAGDVPNTLLFESGSNTNLVTGNLAHSQELFSTRGIELSTGIDLNYSSLNTDAGVLGVGWRHSYEGGLTVNGDSTVVIKEGDGGSRKYVPIGGNLYHSQMGDSSTMVKNGDGTYTITFINGSKKTFNAQGKLTSIKDRFNNTATIAYPSSVLTTITDPASRVTRLEFVGGKLDAVVDPKGNRYTFFYSSGMLWKVVNPVADPAVTTEQGFWEYTYENGRLKTKRDPGGNIFQYSYYPDGRVQSVIDPDGIAAPTDHTRSYIYPPNLTTVDTGVITEKDSGTWSYQIDGVNRTLKNRIAAVTGAETSYTYHFNGLIKSKTWLATDGNHYTVFYSYDIYGNLTWETVPTNLVTMTPTINPELVSDPETLSIYNGTQYYYNDPYGRISGIDDFRGEKVFDTIIWRDLNTSISVPNSISDIYMPPIDMEGADGMNAVTSFQHFYSATTGRQIGFKDGNSDMKSYSYNASGLLDTVSMPDWPSTRYSDYDLNGNFQTVTITGKSGGTKTISYQYTALNQVKSRTVKNTSSQIVDSTTYIYDHNGNQKSVTDRDGRTVNYKYSFDGQLTEASRTRTDTTKVATSLSYKGTGCIDCRDGGTMQLKAVTDPNQKATTYLFNKTGTVERETDALGKIIRYTYYSNGKLKEKFDASAIPEKLLITYGYDKEGRLLSKAFAVNGSIPPSSETYQYDGWGRMITAQNQHISYTFEYYFNGWLKSVVDSSGRKVSYDLYDGNGMVTEMSLVGTTSPLYLTNEYYSGNRPQSILAKKSPTDLGQLFSFDYDTYNRRQSLIYWTGVTTNTTYAYDDLDRLNGITRTQSGNTLYSYSCYERDAAGNCKLQLGSKPITFGYDDLYRLQTAAGEKYDADIAGNRNQGPSQYDTAYVKNNANQLSKGREYSYLYDTSGNQTTKSITNVNDKNEVRIWDAENRLISVVRTKQTAIGTDTRTVTFKYDPMGRRIGKLVVNTVGGNTTTETTAYVYDREDIIQEIHTSDANGITTTSTTNYVHGHGIDEPLAMIRDGQWYFFHTDPLGSINLITNSANGKVVSYDYDSFGVAKPTEYDGAGQVKSTVSFRNAYTFTGREWDKEIGLYYYRNRYYDPTTGIFISKDPKGIAGGDANLYRYVGGNPVNLIDPFGLDAIIALYPGASGFGHVGLGVNSPNTTGFYPAPGSSTWSVATGQTVSGAILPDTRTPISTLTIRTTPSQDQAILNFINSRRRDPGNYNLKGRNCTTTVRDALAAGGINTPLTIYPKEFMRNIQQQFGGQQ